MLLKQFLLISYQIENREATVKSMCCDLHVHGKKFTLRHTGKISYNVSHDFSVFGWSGY